MLDLTGSFFSKFSLNKVSCYITPQSFKTIGRCTAELLIIKQSFFCVFMGACMNTDMGVLKWAWTELRQIWRGHSSIIDACLCLKYFLYLALFRNEVIESRRKQRQNCTYYPSVKLGEGWGDVSEKKSSIHYNRNCGIQLMGGRCAD